jgi:hypothetical protein
MELIPITETENELRSITKTENELRSITKTENEFGLITHKDNITYNLNIDLRDLGLRFVFGGSTVAFCFILLQLIPSKTFAGIFAAFPAIMTAAVIMAGHFGDSEQASDIALGASAGMFGCIICVLTAIFCMEYLGKWGLSLGIALTVWFFVSYITSQLIPKFIEKIKEKKNEKIDF